MEAAITQLHNSHMHDYKWLLAMQTRIVLEKAKFGHLVVKLY